VRSSIIHSRLLTRCSPTYETGIVEEEPKRLTTKHRKEKRGGRVFIDTGRNAYAQTFVSPYAVRPLPAAPIAIPIEWDEVDSIGPQSYTIRNIKERLKGRSDPWSLIWTSARSLREA
jgi:bifunctional non-homologous end joining protein LigD